MDRENKPDREGYLGFKDAIDNGNEALRRRAGALWRAEKPPTTVVAQYLDLYLTEKFADNHFEPAKYKQIEDRASKRVSEIKNPALREKFAKRIERLSNAWFSARSGALLSYCELTFDDLKWETAARQSAKPHETEGQSWFYLKRDIEGRHLDYLDHVRTKFERAVDRQISRALGVEAKTRAAAAQDLARQFAASRHARSANLGKDHDRER
jgi:hypothetical protein